jgi:hypothetical protein
VGRFPVFAYMRYWLSPIDTTLKLVAIALSFGFAVVSWRYVENPFRRGLPNLKGRRLVFFTLAPMIVMLCVSLTIKNSNGFPKRFSPEVLKIAIGALPKGYGGATTESICENVTSSVSFLVWGDSHAKVVAHLCDQLGKRNKLKGAVAYQGGVPSLIDAWTAGTGPKVVAWNNAVVDYATKHQIKNVILVCRWSLYVDSPDGNRNLVINHERKVSTQNNAKEILLKSLKTTVDRLQDQGARVWILKEVPLQKSNPVRKLQLAKILEKPFPLGSSRDQNLRMHQFANEIICEANFPTVSLVDLAANCFDSTNHSIISDGSQSLYVDNNHLSSHGADVLLGQTLAPVFLSMALE